MTLFNAHPKGVEPTKQADTLYNTISKVVKMIDDAENQIKVLASDYSGTINAAVHSWLQNHILTDT